MRLSKCHNISDLRGMAKAKLPDPLFWYMEGGSDDEVSLKRNIAAFDNYVLLPRHLVDVSRIDTATKLFGKTLGWPVILSPTGMSRLFHHGKEVAVARAAASTQTLYTLSTMATTSLEEIAALGDVPKMFQIYVFKDRALTRDLVQRCVAAGYDALCLTVDTPLAGNRERDLRTGMTMPPRFNLQGLASFAMHPGWSMNFLRDPGFRLANVDHRVDALKRGAMPLIDYVNQQFDRSVTWPDVEWLASEWPGALAIKGIQTAGDARRARSAGATALIISNHGGRQLDSTPAPIECLRPIRDAVGSDLELIVDGGVRRGTHILKALALGANACSIGRPYLYGLAAAGEAGVLHALTLLRAELERDMALLGCAAIDEIDDRAILGLGSPASVPSEEGIV